jgi:hypothetical protein
MLIIGKHIPPERVIHPISRQARGFSSEYGVQRRL